MRTCELIASNLVDLAALVTGSAKVGKLESPLESVLPFATTDQCKAAIQEEFENGPSPLSASLLLPESTVTTAAIDEDEVTPHVLGCERRDHILTLCIILGGRAWTPRFVAAMLQRAKGEYGGLEGPSAAPVLAVWGRDDETFDSWDRPCLERLWEEAQFWVGGMNGIVVLPTRYKVRALRRLFAFGISDPVTALDMALELLTAQFAEDLVAISSQQPTRSGNRCSTLRHTQKLPLVERLSADDAATLTCIANHPPLFDQKTNLWDLFGLPDNPSGLLQFVRQRQ